MSVDIYRLQETFYVPVFQVLRRAGSGSGPGQALPDEIVRDVTQITYKDSVKEIDSFELTIGNWDANQRKPKYEPYSEERFRGVFDPGQTLEVHLGYMGNTRLMMSGDITTLEPNYPASGNLTLSVRGLNRLHRFRTEQHTFGWFDKKDSEIARALGGPVQRGRPGMGIRVETPNLQNEDPETFVFMNTTYDIVFLMERARRRGYEVVLVEEQQNGRTEQYLTFGPSSDRSNISTIRLEWGKSLVSFRPTLSTWNQIFTVIVRGWDRRANRQIEGKATWDQVLRLRGPEQQRMQQLAQAFGNRTEIITNRPVHTPAEARRMAESILRDQANQMVEATGSTVGLPDLRAGRKVEIAGLGERFNGVYYVTQTTHTIGDSGYTTEFSAQRLPEQP
jgi:phage protein D